MVLAAHHEKSGIEWWKNNSENLNSVDGEHAADLNLFGSLFVSLPLLSVNNGMLTPPVSFSLGTALKHHT